MSLKAGHLAFAVVLFMSAGVAVNAARADEASAPITVKVNMARILRISAPAATVVIGNPGVADVTIQDPKTLVLTGKSYGQTNMIVLDAKGNPIADTMVEVVQSEANLVTVFSAGERSTLACAPTCAPTVMLGDSVPVTQQMTQSMGLVQSVAQSN
jgi:Flp pilus assembly secretin CpaC